MGDEEEVADESWCVGASHPRHEEARCFRPHRELKTSTSGVAERSNGDQASSGLPRGPGPAGITQASGTLLDEYGMVASGPGNNCFLILGFHY